MRQLIFVLCSTACLSTAACTNKNNPDNDINVTANDVETLYYAIAAGPVTGDRASGINGSFRITEASGPDTGVASNRQGGACIVFRAQDLGYQMPRNCTRNEHCKSGKIDGYCQPGTGQCWARPPAFPDPLCRRSIDAGSPPQWGIDEDIPIKPGAPAIPVPADLRPNAQAVIVACLKWSKQAKPCDDPQSQVKWGQPVPIP